MLAWIHLMSVAVIASLLLLLVGVGDELGRPLALALGAVLLAAGILALGQLVQTRSRRHYTRDLVAHRFRP